MSDLKIEKEVVSQPKPKARNYVLDLRIHSPASLGYLGIQGLDTAPALVRLAKVKGLDVIALTDYYSGDFIDRVSQAAQNSNVTVIPGVDLRCEVGGCDDVNLSVLFQEGFTSAQVNEFLSAIEVPKAASGNKDYLLKTPFAKILEFVDYYQGVALPSRIDKTPHRMQAIPILVEQYGFRAFDVAYTETSQYFKKTWPKTKFQLFSFSDANALAQVGSRTARVKLATPGFAGIKQLVQRTELTK